MTTAHAAFLPGSNFCSPGIDELTVTEYPGQP